MVSFGTVIGIDRRRLPPTSTLRGGRNYQCGKGKCLAERRGHQQPCLGTLPIKQRKPGVSGCMQILTGFFRPVRDQPFDVFRVKAVEWKTYLDVYWRSAWHGASIVQPQALNAPLQH